MTEHVCYGPWWQSHNLVSLSPKGPPLIAQQKKPQVPPHLMEVKLTFLEPNGPSPSFKYPRRPDILTVPEKDILSIVDPQTATGRTYNLSDKEIKKASELLNEKLS